MREVGIHRDDDVVAAAQHLVEPGPIRTSQTSFARAVQDVDAAEFLGQAIGDQPGSVGAVVVDNDDVRVGRCLPNGTQERLDVLRFVVGGKHQDAAHNSCNLLRCLSEHAQDAQR